VNQSPFALFASLYGTPAMLFRFCAAVVLTTMVSLFVAFPSLRADEAASTGKQASLKILFLGDNDEVVALIGAQFLRHGTAGFVELVERGIRWASK
jgi:hypothetical protein